MSRAVPITAEKSGPTAGEIQGQLDRISGSGGLKSSGPILSVFQFLGKHAIECPGQAVKEYEIATNALGRSLDFDPRLDSTVRVVVMRLRSRLAEYYTHEGVADTVLLDIPKGTYCLSVAKRAIADQEAVEHEPETLEPIKGSHRISSRMVLGTAFAILLAACAYIVGRYSAGPHPAQEVKAFWSGLLESGDPLLVFSNPIFQGSPETGMHLLDPTAFHTDGTNDSFTGAGEVMAVHELSESLATFRHGLRVKRARLFTWDEALGNNLIIVGGPAQSSVCRQLPKLQRFILKGPAETPYPGDEAIRDAKPANGPGYYVPSRSGDTGVEYAIVALTPGASDEHWVLILAGTSTFGTEAAARFVSHEGQLGKLLSRLKADPVRRGGIRAFEALLKVEIRGGAPLEPELMLVSIRDR